MPNRPLTIEQILGLLVAAPSDLDALTAALPLAQLHAAPHPGEWSVNDVLAHLRACADVWGNCIVKIIEQEKPTLRAVSPRTWIQKTDYPQQKFRVSLYAFTTQRTSLLSILKPLARKDWSRTATVTGTGKPLERSVRFYAEWLASHERIHLQQIQKTITGMNAH